MIELPDMNKKFKIITGIGLAFLILVFFALFFFGYFLFKELKSVKGDLSLSSDKLSSRVDDLKSEVDDIKNWNTDLSSKISAEQDKSLNFEQTISGISSTVGTLEKLSKTDRELLQKYSKVYFLNENYAPMHLSTIDSKYAQDKTKNLQFHTTVLPYLTRMLDDASTSNNIIQIASAYRSFGTQANVKANYISVYGSGANRFSADQGYSEHQLGTAVDLTTSKVNPVLDISFDKTLSFNWLENNAYKYGFILSYPKNNSYYQYEPWHWRFVGVNLATKLHDENKNFYDLDQREIDTFLVNIFD